MKTAPPEHKSKPATEPHQPLAQPEAEREAGLGVGMPFFLASAAPPPVQPKLRLNQPGDRYEQEADRVAAQVMRMPMAPADTVQRACSCGGTCAHCQGGDEAPLIQRELAGSTSATPSAGTVLPSTNGQPLDAPMRQSFEARFGHDFSGVRIHTGPQASDKAAAIQARAFTTGNNIVFGAGAYAPGTQTGQTLLAHELAHVVQQRSGSTPPGQIQRVFDMENDPNIRRMREQQREQERHRAAEHRRWEASHQERFRTELGSQATTLTEQQQRTEQNLIVQRNQVFEAVRSSESGGLFADLLRLAGLEITLPTTLPADLQQRWNAARQAIEAIRFSLQQSDVTWETQDELQPVFTGFYLALIEFAGAIERVQQAREQREQQRYQEERARYDSMRETTFSGPRGEPGEGAFRGAWSLANPPPQPAYRADPPVSPTISPMLENVNRADAAAGWHQVVQDFNQATRIMDRLLLSLLPESSRQRQGMEYFSSLGDRLAQLEREHPLAVPIPAVFYPKDKFVQLPDPNGAEGTMVSVAEGIPWQFYLYHTGVASHDQPARAEGEWVLVDLTSPRQERANRQDSSAFDAAMLQQGDVRDPPQELFEQLNTKLRFPEGQLYWQMPSGTAWTLTTTAEWELSDWFAAIGMTLGAVALIAGVVITGGLAAPAAAPALGAIATAAGIGAAGFGIASTLSDTEERRRQGMLTQRDIDRAALAIAIDVAGALALGMGQLVRGAGQIGTMGSRLAAYTGRYWFMVQRGAQATTGAALIGDTAQLMTASSDFITAYRAIQRHPGMNQSERDRALVQLVSTGLLTGGLLTLSIRGGLSDILPGTNLHLVGVDADGRAMVQAAGELPTGSTPHAGGPGTPVPRPDTPEATIRVAPDPTTPTTTGWSRPLLAPHPGSSQVEASLPSGRVEIRVSQDEAGLVTGLQIRHAPDASAVDIAIHERMGGLIRLYGGQIGRIPLLINQLRRAFGGNPPPLTLQMELRKLRLTAAERQQRLAQGGLSEAEVRQLESQLDLLRHEINNVEAAITNPDLRSRYASDVVALPVRPSDVPNLPDPPANHHYYLSPYTNRWELRRNRGYAGPRFDVEYDAAGAASGRLTNAAQVGQLVEGRELNASTRSVLESLGYRIDRNEVIYRPRGHDAPGHPHMAPLQVENGRIRVATSESLGEQQSRIRAGLDTGQETRLRTVEQGLAPGERMVLVEGLYDTGVTWAQVLRPTQRTRLRAILAAEGVPDAEIQRLIDNLIGQTGTLKVVLGTRGVRESFPYRREFGQTHGPPAPGVEVHHGNPLYLGGDHTPELLFGLSPGPHEALHRFFDALEIPQGPLQGTSLQPNRLQTAAQADARPAYAIIDTGGNIRYGSLDAAPTTTP